MRGLFAVFALLACVPAVADAQAHILIVSGLGGEPKYVEEFHEWGTTMVDAARTRLGLPAENVVLLAEDPGRDPARITAESRKENVERAVAEMAARAGPDDRIMILLIGHGSADARGSRVNLPGPDLTADEYAELVRAFAERPLVFVNTASASGDFHDALAGPNRTILTATRSGRERNETIFGRYFVQAFAADGADSNRDGRVTITEAFEYAVRETERAYQMNNLLQMEHARMEGDLEMAKVFHLAGSASAEPGDASPEVAALFRRRQELEERIDNLRLRAGEMDAAEYTAELERLLLELARTNREIEGLEGR